MMQLFWLRFTTKILKFLGTNLRGDSAGSVTACHVIGCLAGGAFLSLREERNQRRAVVVARLMAPLRPKGQISDIRLLLLFHAKRPLRMENSERTITNGSPMTPSSRPRRGLRAPPLDSPRGLRGLYEGRETLYEYSSIRTIVTVYRFSVPAAARQVARSAG